MYNFYFLLFFSFIRNIHSETCVAVKDNGIYTVTPGDVGMVFWMKLQNSCNEKFHINVKMIHCTELINETEEEPSGIYLIGGYMGILYGKSYLIATLIYPNMYMYNREGSCMIGIHYTDVSHTTHFIREHMKFNTSPKDGVAPTEVRKFYKTRSSLKYCETPDLDSLDRCGPVDCMMKYLGVRNFYNERWRRCQKVPACVSNGMRDEPDVSYIPTSNRCRNLASCITENDISLLEEGLVSNKSDNSFSSRGLYLRCNHGVLDNTTGICRCKEGYTSAEPDIENYVPGLTVYHMCNIKVDSWNEANFPKIRSTILAFSTLAVIITMVILLLTFCCYGVYIYLKSYERLSPFESSAGSSEESEYCEGAELYDRLRSRSHYH